MEFVRTRLIFEDGSDDRVVWLADVIKILDAIDEEASDLTVLPIRGKTYALGGAKNLIFFREAIGDEHLFRIKYSEDTAACDKSLVAEFKRRKLKEASFIEIGMAIP